MVIFRSKQWSMKLLDWIFELHKLLLSKEEVTLAQVIDLCSLMENGLTQGQLTWSGPLHFHSAIMQQQCPTEYMISEML